MNTLLKLWKFSRPHTIIGSTLSMISLYLIACGQIGEFTNFTLLVLALTSALGCNVFIVGLNQILDVEIDRINKPFLPIPSGELTIKQGYTIILFALIICLMTSIFIGGLFLALIGSILLIGVLYSVPPVRLKKHHLPAAVAISGVRGILVNLGIGYFFLLKIVSDQPSTEIIVTLTIFMTLFSIAIAWLKDLYDYDGDKKHRIQTLAVIYNLKTAHRVGLLLVIVAYLYQLLVFYNNEELLFWLTLFSCISFLIFIFTSSIENKKSIYRFYMIFWVFFFLEYFIFITDSIVKINISSY